MGKLSWINEEHQIIDGGCTIGARVNIEDLQNNKHRAINEIRWKLYQELIKQVGEHPNIEGCFYVNTWIDINPYNNEISLCGRIQTINVNVCTITIAKPLEYMPNGKLSLKQRLKILFKGEL